MTDAELDKGGAAERTSVVLVAHPSPDVYGSDLQLVESVRGLAGSGRRVLVLLPADGPLVPLVRDAGAEVRIVAFPVLRRALVSPARALAVLLMTPVWIVRLWRLTRSVDPDVVYVNTVTVPWWVVAARAARVAVVVHVHEAEEGWPGIVRWLLAAPLLLTSSVIANSRASRRVLLESIPRLAARTTVLYNGIPGPAPEQRVPQGEPVSLAIVARLSPRKGVDIALEAVALLRRAGRDVVLDVCGETFRGYEWFEARLRARAAEPDLAGAVRFLGYVHPTWEVLSSAAAVLVPSRVEPFGNTAVEGQLVGRPVIASSVQGLTEIVADGQTGFLVPPGDADALAAVIGRVLDDPRAAAQIADRGRDEALIRFAADRYQGQLRVAVEQARSSPRLFGSRRARLDSRRSSGWGRPG